MSQKGFINIVLIVLIVMLAGIVGYVTLVKKTTPTKQTQSNNSQNTQTNKITNWETYTNTKYHYQIKYPANWTIEVDGVAVWQNQVPNPELGNDVVFLRTKTEPYGQTAKTLWNIRVFVSPAENPKKLSPRDWFIEQSKLDFSYGAEQKFDNLEDATFKGFPALKIKSKAGEKYGFLIAKDALIYNLSFSFEKFNGDEFNTPPEQFFLEMLDSFVFN